MISCGVMTGAPVAMGDVLAGKYRVRERLTLIVVMSCLGGACTWNSIKSVPADVYNRRKYCATVSDSFPSIPEL